MCSYSLINAILIFSTLLETNFHYITNNQNDIIDAIVSIEMLVINEEDEVE